MSKNRQEKSEHKKIGEILVEMGFITPNQLEEAIKLTKEKNIRTGEALFQMGALDHDRFYWVLGNQMNMSYLQLMPEMIDDELLSRFPIDILEELKCLPLYELENEIHVAIADPGNTSSLERLMEFTKGKTFNPHLALPEMIKAILEYYRRKNPFQEPKGVDKQESPASILSSRISIMEQESGFSDPIRIVISAPGGTVFKVSQCPSGIHLWRLEKGGVRDIFTLTNADLDAFLDGLRKNHGMEREYGFPFWSLLKSPEGDPPALLRCHTIAGLGSSLLLIERLPDFMKENFLQCYPDCQKMIAEIGKFYRKKTRLLLGGPDVNFIKQCLYLVREEICKDSDEFPALFVEKDIAMRFPNVIQTDLATFHISGIPSKFSINPSSFLLYESEPAADGANLFPEGRIFDSWDDIIIIDFFQNRQEMEKYLFRKNAASIGRFGLLYVDTQGLHEFKEIDSFNRRP